MPDKHTVVGPSNWYMVDDGGWDIHRFQNSSNLILEIFLTDTLCTQSEIESLRIDLKCENICVD